MLRLSWMDQSSGLAKAIQQDILDFLTFQSEGLVGNYSSDDILLEHRGWYSEVTVMESEHDAGSYDYDIIVTTGFTPRMSDFPSLSQQSRSDIVGPILRDSFRHDS